MNRLALRSAARRASASATRVPMRSFQVKSLDDVRAAGRVHYAATGTWESRRYFLAEDGVGFSMHNTVLVNKPSCPALLSRLLTRFCACFFVCSFSSSSPHAFIVQRINDVDLVQEPF